MTRTWISLKAAAAIVICLLPTLLAGQPNGQERVLDSATYGWRPFIYQQSDALGSSYSGLDVRLAEAAARQSGLRIRFLEETTWEDLMARIRSGDLDVAVSAIRNPEREKYARFSAPFRTSINVLYLPRGRVGDYHFGDAREMLELFQEQDFRLGVVAGYAYGDTDVDAYVAAPPRPGLVKTAPDDASLFDLLLNGQIDGFITDQIVGANLAAAKGVQHQVVEHPTQVSQLGYYVIFSKASVGPEVVAAFNAGLAQIQQSGEYRALVRNYLFPVLLSFTTSSTWFYLVELLGVVAFALSGVMIAARGEYGLFGALVLAAIPGVGGGIVRDLVSGRETLAIVQAPSFAMAVIGLVAVAYLLILARQFARGLPFVHGSKTWNRRRAVWITELLDAIGLSTLSLTGVLVALETKMDPLWLWGPALAAITSTAGGLMRDALIGNGQNVMLKGEIYPEIAIFFGVAFSLFLEWYAMRLTYHASHIFWAMVIVLMGSLIARLFVVAMGWRSPVFNRFQQMRRAAT